MKVTAVIFSPTGNTEKYVTEMVRVTGEVPEVINVTSRDSEERVFGPDELVFLVLRSMEVSSLKSRQSVFPSSKELALRP